MQQYVDSFGFIKNYDPQNADISLLMKEIFGKVPKDHQVLQENNGLGWVYTYMVDSSNNWDGFRISQYNNNLISITKYEHNIRNGRFYSWHHNGVRKSETLFINDVPHGYFSEWNDDGEVINITRYDYGRFDGFHLEYNHENNKLEELSRYRENLI